MRRLIDGGLSVHFGEDRTKSILISEAIGLNKINMNINIYRPSHSGHYISFKTEVQISSQFFVT